MKKTTILFLVLVFVVGLSSPSYAAIRKDRSAIRGKLVSIDRSKQEVVVKDDNSGQEVKFVVKGAIDDGLVSGSKVIVIYKVGTNVATKVSVPRKK